MKKILSSKTAFLFILLMAFAVGFGQSRSVEAAANIKFNATNVNLPGGCTQLIGNLVNHGNEGATIESAVVKITIFDMNGRKIWSDVCNFTDVDVWVPAGGNLTHQFNIWNDNCPSYSGRVRFQWSVDLFWEN